MTYDQAAFLLGRSRQLLYYYIAKGELHPVKIYGRRLLPRIEVIKLLAQLGASKKAKPS